MAFKAKTVGAQSSGFSGNPQQPATKPARLIRRTNLFRRYSRTIFEVTGQFGRDCAALSAS